MNGLGVSYPAIRAEAAVHGDDGARDERGRVAAEPEHRALQLGGVAKASHGGAGKDLLRALGGGAVLPEEHRAILLCHEEPWCDRVDPESLAVAAGEGHGHPAGEAL